MANRLFNQFLFGLERMPVRLYLHATIGSSGAVTLDSANSKGIASINLDSTGQYTVTLSDSYSKLLGISVMNYSSTSAQAAPFCTLEAYDVVTAKTLTIQYRAVNNSTATNPASGEEIFMEIKLGN